MKILGVDTGGTFTDFVFSDGEKVRTHKVLSTPHAPEEAILQGIREMGLDGDGLRIVHGSTVATNAVLEGKGVSCAYITNRGFGDVLTIGRQARKELYNLQPEPQSPPVPPEFCLETGGRLAADGSEIEPLSDDDIARLAAEIERLAPQAVAINLLFSFLDGGFERRIEQALPDDLFVSRSSAVLNEYREYERGMATWLNAYVGPLMQGYLSRLQQGVSPARVSVMQSHGGTIAAEHAASQSVQLLLSGPAGGLVGAQFQSARSGITKLMSFDMGGTSTDVALMDGEIRLSNQGEIAGYPVAVPMVDMHTIGAGGGSIAWIDEGGLLQVGPQSAGASPGPACYGKGGEQPTVTDANVVLGRLPSTVALGGSLSLDVDHARAAIGRIAKPLGLAIEEAAQGVIAIANEHMAQALRVISVQRGHDPADYTLMSFGGAGGLHVCALANHLQMSEALVPAMGGVLSALGMLVAPLARQTSRTHISPLAEVDEKTLDSMFGQLEQDVVSQLHTEGAEQCVSRKSVELRYVGQSTTLSVDWTESCEQAAAAFHEQHAELHGHALSMEVELVTLRVRAEAAGEGIGLPECIVGDPAEPIAQCIVVGMKSPVPVYARDALAVGQVLSGPVVVMEKVSTTWVEPGWIARNDAAGNLLLSRVS